MTATYTTQTEAPVTIAGRVFTVETQTMDSGRVTTWLIGSRGAVYFLREFTGPDTGVRQVISFKSGAPLRDKCSREVRVLLVGDMIEEITR
jgi:hypothetical protein